MIRLRHSLERACAHPLLGPVVVIAMVVLLALVVLHVAHEGWELAGELGAMCLALASVLGLVFVYQSTGPPPVRAAVRGDRGPPRDAEQHVLRVVLAAGSRNHPLRR